MLYWLTQHLTSRISGFNVFSYLTFRAILATVSSLAISLLVGPAMIEKLSRYQIGQVVRDDGPKTHLPKAGTPTMGGTLILVTTLVSTLLWAEPANRLVWTVLAVTFAFGFIGFYDDYLKLVVRHPAGLVPRWKYFWQSVAGIAKVTRTLPFLPVVLLWIVIMESPFHLLREATSFVRCIVKSLTPENQRQASM